MSVTGEISGVTLTHVARRIDGDIETTTTKFDPKIGENVKKPSTVKNPVIVFFPNGMSQVMTEKRADSLGFLGQPEILNFAQVEDQQTAAGRYKHAIRDDQRRMAWLEMEQSVVNACISKSGHPLPLDCVYSDESVYLEPVKQQEHVQ